MRRGLAPLAIVAALLLAAAGLWSAASDGGSHPPDDVEAVAATLRCPTCVAESVADSNAPMAEAMRKVIEEQSGEGRTPDEIRAWFVERYGTSVLLEPQRRGAGLALWLFPLVATPVACWLILRRRGSRRSAPAWLAGAAGFVVIVSAVLLAGRGDGASPTSPAGAGSDRQGIEPQDATAYADPVDLLRLAVQDAPGDDELRIALGQALERRNEFASAAEQYLAAARATPNDDTVLYRAAFALTRAERGGDARPLLERLVARSPDHPEGLLLLGTLLHQDGDPAAEAVLRRFLSVAPDHPGAEQAAAMLGEGLG